MTTPTQPGPSGELRLNGDTIAAQSDESTSDQQSIRQRCAVLGIDWIEELPQGEQHPRVAGWAIGDQPTTLAAGAADKTLEVFVPGSSGGGTYASGSAVPNLDGAVATPRGDAGTVHREGDA